MLHSSFTHFARVVTNVRVDATLNAVEIESSGARCLQSSTDDVLGLGADLRVREAAIGAIRKYGLTPGPHTRVREELEQRLAAMLSVERARVVPDASLGIALGDRLEVVVVEALRPFEGDLAPLPRLIEEAQRDHVTLVSIEALGLGVLGQGGGGVAEHLGVAGQVDLQLVQLGALGAAGLWAVGGKREAVESLDAFTQLPLSPPGIAAGLRALEILQSEPQRRQRAFDVAQRILSVFRARGFDTGPGVTPWVPLWLGDESFASQWLRALHENGVAARALLAGQRSRLLLSPAATITDAQLSTLLEVIERVAKKLPPPGSSTARAPVTVSRPGSFVTSAPCGDRWSVAEEPEDGPLPETQAGARTLTRRVFEAVETLTWRAANLKTTRLPGTDAIRTLIDRARNRK